MPILHDNRNMRPDLLEKAEVDVDDIFASADAQMAEQRQKQLFVHNKKRINWRKKIRRSVTLTFLLVILILIAVSAFAIFKTYTSARSFAQDQVIIEVTKIKNNIAAKDESELTEEDLVMLSIFEVLSDEDIKNIVHTATSVEEIIQIIKTQEVDIARYLTPEQQTRLEQILMEYSKSLEERTQQLEAEETISTENTEATTANESVEEPTEMPTEAVTKTDP